MLLERVRTPYSHSRYDFAAESDDDDPVFFSQNAIFIKSRRPSIFKLKSAPEEASHREGERDGCWKGEIGYGKEGHEG